MMVIFVRTATTFWKMNERSKAMTTRYLTTEPPLDPPEPIDYKALSRKRDQMQEYTYEQYNDEVEKEQELINNWRMYDALEDSLIEMEGK
jgi:hypothetical protein